MKKQICAALLALSVIGVAAVTTASAQVTEKITFKTDFPFTVGDTKFPAGSYVVKPLDDTLSVMELSDGEVSAFFEVEGLSPTTSQPAKNEVVFNKYGDAYVLSEIWDADDDSGAKAVKSQTEQRHASRHPQSTKHRVPTTRATGS
jgi:hypothetical protein